MKKPSIMREKVPLFINNAVTFIDNTVFLGRVRLESLPLARHKKASSGFVRITQMTAMGTLGTTNEGTTWNAEQRFALFPQNFYSAPKAIYDALVESNFKLQQAFEKKETVALPEISCLFTFTRSGPSLFGIRFLTKEEAAAVFSSVKSARVPSTKAAATPPASTKQPDPASKPQNIKTFYNIVVDESSSMNAINANLITDQVRNLIKAIKDASIANNQQSYVSIFTFGPERYNRDRRYNADVRLVQPITDLRTNDVQFNDYKAVGDSTPLFASIVYAAQHTETASRDYYVAGDNVAYFTYVITDGEENTVDSGSLNKLIQSIKDKLATDKHTFALQVPNKKNFLSRFPAFPDGCVEVWNVTSKGFEAAIASTSKALSNYSVLRSTGATKMASVYVNLKDITPADIAKLKDISKDVKFWTVEEETDIRTFAEKKTGLPYVHGSCYYALTKLEKIQSYKNILLGVKNTKTVYTGPELRDLIGLSGSDVKATPGNMSDFDVYVQSTSHNRKLVRGTRVVYFPPQGAVQKTWDPAAAAAAAAVR